jgi:hypothetical protein
VTAKTRPAPERAATGSARPSRRAAAWNWRTFPVFLAFAGGLFIASLINSPPQNIAAAVVQLAAIFGVGYGIAHVVAVRVALRRRSREDTAEDDEWVEEIVYPDDERRAGS